MKLKFEDLIDFDIVEYRKNISLEFQMFKKENKTLSINWDLHIYAKFFENKLQELLGEISENLSIRQEKLSPKLKQMIIAGMLKNIFPIYKELFVPWCDNRNLSEITEKKWMEFSEGVVKNLDKKLKLFEISLKSEERQRIYNRWILFFTVIATITGVFSVFGIRVLC